LHAAPPSLHQLQRSCWWGCGWAWARWHGPTPHGS
jgi:hypothetical protein